MLEKAKEILERLDKQQRINSQEFEVVFNALTGEKYKHANCAPCWKTAIAKLRSAVEKKSQIQPVTVAENKPEPIEPTEVIEEIKPVKKSKKK